MQIINVKNKLAKLYRICSSLSDVKFQAFSDTKPECLSDLVYYGIPGITCTDLLDKLKEIIKEA